MNAIKFFVPFRRIIPFHEETFPSVTVTSGGTTSVNFNVKLFSHSLIFAVFVTHAAVGVGVGDAVGVVVTLGIAVAVVVAVGVSVGKAVSIGSAETVGVGVMPPPVFFPA